MRCSTLYMCLLSSVALSACTTFRPPQISYDDPPAEPAVLERDPPKPVQSSKSRNLCHCPASSNRCRASVRHLSCAIPSSLCFVSFSSWRRGRTTTR